MSEEKVITWSQLTAECAERHLAPEGPVRLFVQVDLDEVECEIFESRVTSYNDRAQPYADGERARIHLTVSELEWLSGRLNEALAQLKTAEKSKIGELTDEDVNLTDLVDAEMSLLAHVVKQYRCGTEGGCWAFGFWRLPQVDILRRLKARGYVELAEKGDGYVDAKATESGVALFRVIPGD